MKNIALFGAIISGIYALSALFDGEFSITAVIIALACFLIFNDRRKAPLREAKRRKEEEEARIRAIIDNPDSYLSIPRERGLTVLAEARASGNVEKWATALEQRHAIFQDALNKANILLDHYATKFQNFRTGLLERCYASYKEVMRPFFPALHEAEQRGKIRVYKVADPFVFPQGGTKQAFRDSLAGTNASAISAINHFRHSHTHTSGDWITLAIGVAISVVLNEKRKSEARVKLEAAQGEVEEYVGNAVADLTTIRGYKDYVDSQMKELSALAAKVDAHVGLLQSASQNVPAHFDGRLESLDASMQERLVTLYVAGEALGRALTADEG